MLKIIGIDCEPSDISTGRTCRRSGGATLTLGPKRQGGLCRSRLLSSCSGDWFITTLLLTARILSSISSVEFLLSTHSFLYKLRRSKRISLGLLLLKPHSFHPVRPRNLVTAFLESCLANLSSKPPRVSNTASFRYCFTDGMSTSELVRLNIQVPSSVDIPDV